MIDVTATIFCYHIKNAITIHREAFGLLVGKRQGNAWGSLQLQ